jgi:hypothetical protein
VSEYHVQEKCKVNLGCLHPVACVRNVKLFLHLINRTQYDEDAWGVEVQICVFVLSEFDGGEKSTS